MDQPQFLLDPSDDSVDIDVTDLSPTARIPPICPHCSEDIAPFVKRVENSVWRTARRTFAKREPKQPKPDPTADRVGKLETLVSTALAVLIPGLGAADPSTKKDETR